MKLFKLLDPAEIARRYADLPDSRKREISELVETLDRLRTESNPPSSQKSDGSTELHRAIGRLLFLFEDAQGKPKPIHHMRVELWDRDPVVSSTLLAGGDLLGSGETRADGTFEITYDPKDAGLFDTPDLELRIFEPHHKYSRGVLVEEYKLVDRVPGSDNVKEGTYDFGDLRVPYWEYNPAAPTPRLLINQQGQPPTSYSPGRAMAMLKSVTPLELAKEKHLAENRLDPSKPSLETIQEDYPESLTLHLEKETPGCTRGDEYFGQRLLNGMYARIFDQDPDDADRLWIHDHWGSYPQDGEHGLPDVDVFFELRDGIPWPVEIRLALRQPGAKDPGSPVEHRRFTPDEGDAWLEAKHVARVSHALAAELDTHLALTHLNVEQYALAAHRNLRRSPVRQLLFPHLREVVLINHEADSFLLGETGYITRASALTDQALHTRLKQVVGTLDWKGYQPRRPLSEKHTYAQAAQIFWQILEEVVDHFFAENDEEIRENWLEVHRFSDDLVNHCVPRFLCSFLGGQLEKSEGAPWLGRDERTNLEPTTQETASNTGAPGALHPITKSDSVDDEGLANLKQVCRYVIFLATFKHTWSNNRQYEDGGESLYNSLGLRYGDHGLLAPESDLSVAPPPDRASELLWISGMLSMTSYGHILHNEDDDIHPYFIRALKKRRGELEALGVDVERINSRINI